LFKILQRADCNILANITKGDQLTFRKIVIKTILATDLQKHFEMVKTFRARMEETELPSLEDEKFRLNALELCVKCADLGHGAKKVSLHKEWSGLITKEFYAQGDLEAKHGLPVSSLNDRSGVVSTSQIGFLNALVRPLFEIWEDFVRKFSEETESELAVLTCMNNIRENLAFWAAEHDLFIRGTPSFVIDSLPPPMLMKRGKS
jgi:3',5'-cyclic-nucleotide phosphodiesterase/cAMP-specific phosphodiesterase 4